MTEVKKYELNAHTKAEIDKWLTKFPEDKKQSAVLYALRMAQEQNDNWLPRELMDEVAAYLGMPKIAVYEVATFYSMYNLTPVGKHEINVCTNISCMLNDSDKILAHFKKRLGIGLNETTPDGKFHLREVECLAACRNAPVCQIGKDYHEELTPEKIDKILDELE